MKPALVALLGLGLTFAAAPAFAQTAKPAKPTKLAAAKTPAKAKAAPAKPVAAPATEPDRRSYIIGHQIGTNLLQAGMTLNPDVVARAVADELRGIKSTLTPEETQTAMMGYQQEAQAKASEHQNAAAGPNIAAGKAFLAENAKKAGVKTTASGLQYIIEKEGAGASPTGADQVKVHYRGTLLDGKEFDSSYKRGEPITFGVTQVIRGWTEALQLMKPGAKWQLFIPQELAYGSQGAGADIPPGATLRFDVELLEIIPGSK